tara:strand:+ start:4596 stop:5864 length:1269 start_codon:yes stop_codon:yes gene_type:complete
MNYFRSGNTLIAVLEGTTFQKTFTNGEETESALSKLQDFGELSLVEIAEIFSYSAESKISQVLEQHAKVEEQRDIIELMNDISQNGHEYLEVRKSYVYAKGIDIAMPETVVREFMVRNGNKKDTSALMKFWSLACLNPNADTRDRLFEFCDKHGIKLTDKGYLVVYRNADKKDAMVDDINLHDYIYASMPEWSSIGLDLDTTNISRNPEGKFEIHNEVTGYSDGGKDGGTFIGNISELLNVFENSGQKVIYTDHYSRRTHIEFGKPVSLPESQIDSNPNNQCSKGLHVAGENWLTQNYFGDSGLVCLVNPMNVRAIPYADRGKMRVKEYMAVGVAKYDDNGSIIGVPTKTFEHDYQTITASEIADMLKSVNTTECSDEYLIPTEVTESTIQTIFNNVIEINPEELMGRTDGRVHSLYGSQED